MQKLVSLLRWLHIDNFVYSLVKSRAERKMWRSAVPDDGQLDENGLCIALPIRSFCSVAQVGRDFVLRLKRTSIPFSIFNLDCGYQNAGRLPDSEVADLLAMAKPKIRERNVLAFANEAVHGDSHYVYASQPWWEFESGLLNTQPDIFSGVRHVVLMSDFCERYFKTVAPTSVQVHKICYPCDESWVANESRNETRHRYGIPDGAFVVMFHFMFGSNPTRKNPQGALKAFVKAFANEPRACLVLKVAEANPTSPAYQELMASIAPIKDRVVFVEGFLTRQEILNLLAASDTYISMHRGEGFGIGMLEAMAVKTPVVCTNYGGNTEFCTQETAYLVDYMMVPNDPLDHFYRGVAEWPEPSIETAARHLRHIFENPAAAHAKADRALTFARYHFSIANFEADVKRLVAAMNMVN